MTSKQITGIIVLFFAVAALLATIGLFFPYKTAIEYENDAQAEYDEAKEKIGTAEDPQGIEAAGKQIALWDAQETRSLFGKLFFAALGLFIALTITGIGIIIVNRPEPEAPPQEEDTGTSDWLNEDDNKTGNEKLPDYSSQNLYSSTTQQQPAAQPQQQPVQQQYQQPAQQQYQQPLQQQRPPQG